MIKSLEQLAVDPTATPQQWGDKTMGLAELIVDMEEQKFECAKPEGFGADIDPPLDKELMRAFDYLRAKIKTTLEGRIAGALICRSSAYGEKSGVNSSIPTLYDSAEIEKSYRDFRAAFDRVRYNPEKPGDKTKPVLMQVLQGEITYTGLEFRTVGSCTWPAWSDFDTGTAEEGRRILEPMTKAIRDIMERENKTAIYLFLGNSTGVLHKAWALNVERINDIEGTLIDTYSLMRMDSPPQDEDHIGLDQQGNIVDHLGTILVGVGNIMNFYLLDVPAKPVIGEKNEAFVARSHCYGRPNMAGIEVARGLTSYLVGGLSPRRIKMPKGKMLYYFSPRTGKLIETVNLGHDFLHSSFEHYRQPHIEAFSITEGKIVALEDKGRSFYPHLEYSTWNKTLLNMAQYYARKKNKPIELEGGIIDGTTHVWQMMESPLPKDVISKLTKIPEDRVVYRCEAGRGAISFKGDMVIDDGQSNVSPKKDQLVIGFDASVTKHQSFVYIASDESVMAAAGRPLASLATHLAGFASQVTFEAAGEHRQGGVYYGMDKREFLALMTPYIQEINGQKIIPNICVEACLEGMQIYK